MKNLTSLYSVLSCRHPSFFLLRISVTDIDIDRLLYLYGSHQHAGTRLVLKCEWLDLLTMRECCCFESAPGIHWAKAKPQHMLRLKMESRESVASHCCSRGTCSLYVLEF